jgi:hypothetical protein
LKYWSFDNLIWFTDYLANTTNLKIKKSINILIINIFRINLILQFEFKYIDWRKLWDDQIYMYIYIFLSLSLFFSLSNLWNILNKIQNPCNYLELPILSYITKIYIDNIYKTISFNNQKITKLQNTKRNERENPKAAKRIDKTQASNLTKINIIQLYWTD